MEVSQITLAKLLLYSFYLGIATGVFYDLGRAVRILLGLYEYREGQLEKIRAWHLPLSRRPLCSYENRGVMQSLMINIFDFATVLAATVGILVLSYSYNSGRVRFFVLLGAAVGVFLYRLLLSKTVFAASRVPALLARYLLLSFLVVFCAPIAKLYRLLLYYIKKIAYLYIFTLEKKREKVYNIEEEVFLAENGKKTDRKAHRIMPDTDRGEE